MVQPQKMRDHDLTGDWAGYRECHIIPDLLLIYKKVDVAAVWWASKAENKTLKSLRARID
ncbi:type II toxin-antitoxin system mRNA interferase toxin, RelE/StbE family [Salmonella enterica]|nr:type II toxin-antitoxin system mRNA interferase toxin, RelE/StbE family [Salmonella enterica]ECC9414794.1 hypothetical protein [Salmonella enterica subsp. enterica]EHF1448518.1 type II toxin-antitoxin system mRNA interferase toxin, RelE/StbE family [Salmonella enterica subsp. enterica serovar 4,5,12:b:-]EHG1528594.1 type II toxin-antitoxin system mRNA interferase toxin, RelE/StbE family [Salmonella enterica subsp. enterica serovar 4,[5],12:b:-]ECD8848736.1 type II toxin-antitoxin system mRNA